jgi:hypothetical protein
LAESVDGKGGAPADGSLNDPIVAPGALASPQDNGSTEADLLLQNAPMSAGRTEALEGDVRDIDSATW